VTIDTAMINDVPGYAWALPDLFTEAGVTRVAFRANSIRGRFLWYRPGAVPRPFYWQGPAGSRLFVWYTDSYREGNFFRPPGLFENEFLNHAGRNEQAGCWVDDIQLRMGGDNLPPELNTSKNARAWNEKYLWPRVVVATNREYLETLEKRYGAKCETHRGDIPSWWADGPASSAKETGANRLLHDRLVAAEALWTLAWLADPTVPYPRKEINAAYDKMIHFDEHTWGASGAISDPHSENTLIQWKFKAAYEADAEKMTNDLYRRALKQVSGAATAPGGHRVAIWNTLTWPRTDVVELPLAGTPLDGAAGALVTDTRDNKPVASQLSADGKRLFFIAKDVPALACVEFTIRSAPPAATTEKPAKEGTLENAFYRLTASPAAGGLSSWDDKQLKRELLDPNREGPLNQPIHERVPAGREAVDNFTQRTEFIRTLPQSGRLVSQHRGPVFQEMTIETSLPKCPKITQTVRIYDQVKVVDIIDVFTKEEETQPEGIYVRFPFDVPDPEFRVQIADATMRPEKDQLPYSCRDFYSIQHWINIAGKGYGIAVAPIEAPLVLCSGLHVGKWADHIAFDNGHVYSWVMNNYWYTNFCAFQTGEIPSRYRLTSYAGQLDSVALTRFAWQPFHPLEGVWLGDTASARPARQESPFTLEGDTAVISCVKLAEADDAIIVRLLEMSGKPSQCRLRWALPRGTTIARAYRADAVERPGASINVVGNSIEISLRANEIATIGLVPRHAQR
jgi:alpha-mannosidase